MCALNGCPRFLNVVGYACLCTCHGAVCYGSMSCNTHLSSEHTPFAYLGAAGYAYLCRHYGVRTYLVVMSYLHQIVQLYTFMNDGGSHDSAVHAGIGADLYVILYDGNANLGYLLVAILCWLEAKSVCSNHTTGVQDAVVANLAVVIYYGIAVDFCIVAPTVTWGWNIHPSPISTPSAMATKGPM